MIDFSTPYKYARSVDAFVIHGPNPDRTDYKDENNWLIGVDIGLTQNDRGFQLRKELAYELIRFMTKALPDAGFVERKFVHHDYGVEHLYIAVDKNKKDGTEVNVSELEDFVKQAVAAVNKKKFPGGRPILTFTEKTWENITLGILNPKLGPGWSME